MALYPLIPDRIRIYKENRTLEQTQVFTGGCERHVVLPGTPEHRNTGTPEHPGTSPIQEHPHPSKKKNRNTLRNHEHPQESQEHPPKNPEHFRKTGKVQNLKMKRTRGNMKIRTMNRNNLKDPRHEAFNYNTFFFFNETTLKSNRLSDQTLL